VPGARSAAGHGPRGCRAPPLWKRLVVGVSMEASAGLPLDIARITAHEVPIRTGALGCTAAHACPVTEIASPFTRPMAGVAVDADRRDIDERTCHDALLESHDATAGRADGPAVGLLRSEQRPLRCELRHSHGVVPPTATDIQRTGRPLRPKDERGPACCQVRHRAIVTADLDYARLRTLHQGAHVVRQTGRAHRLAPDPLADSCPSPVPHPTRLKTAGAGVEERQESLHWGRSRTAGSWDLSGHRGETWSVDSMTSVTGEGFRA
jgi:hypothetical protein